jgi:protein-L-isoaspartate(D-aspartate) O-methyltransferase
MQTVWCGLILMISISLMGFGAQMSSGNTSSETDDEYKEQRQRMVESQLIRRGIEHTLTLQAMENVPRHQFIPENRQRQAYNDGPVPIGYGQTISQPYIVAFMTEVLNPEPGQRILEIGTGSGYQAAVLAEITDEVYTIEIIEELAEFGEGNLRNAGYDKVRVKHADGYYGWEEYAPFDAIIVTAAADHIPPPLIEQLKDDGVMIIPVGHPMRTQQLMKVTLRNGQAQTQSLMPVRFVPFTRDE